MRAGEMYKTALLTVLLLAGSFFLKAQDIEKEDLIDAINSGSKYIATVLLDENGKSRCEYSIIDGQWQDYEPAWHTGQLIFALTRAYNITGNTNYIESAKKAGNWWCSLQINDGSNLDGMLRAIHGAGINYIVFATVSDGTAGLFRLSKITGVEKYSDVAISAGEWMYENMYLPEEGLCYDMVDPATGEVQKKWSAFWEDKEQQILTDVARPNNEGSLFLDIFRQTGDEKFKEAFLNLSNSIVNRQDAEGVWMEFTPNDKKKNSIHPRFNLWYAESLIDAYDLTGDEKYILAAQKTARFYQSIQQKDGTFYYKNYIDGTPPNRSSVCGSTVSFAGIIWLRLLQSGYGGEFEKNIQKSVDWVLKNRFSDDNPDKNLRGAFINTRTKIKKGEVKMVNRDVGTSFGVRFLADYYNYLADK